MTNNENPKILNDFMNILSGWYHTVVGSKASIYSQITRRHHQYALEAEKAPRTIIDGETKEVAGEVFPLATGDRTPSVHQHEIFISSKQP